jgi:hypothetical protein
LGLKKKLKNGDWKIIAQHLGLRGNDKATGIYIHNVFQEWHKVRKEMRRAHPGPPNAHSMCDVFAVDV